MIFVTPFDVILLWFQVEYKAPDLIQYLPYEKKRPANRFRFTTNRPWTEEFKRQNENIRDPVFVEPISEWIVFRGDRVELLVGRDKGKQGIVSQVIRNWDLAICNRNNQCGICYLPILLYHLSLRILRKCGLKY